MYNKKRLVLLVSFLAPLFLAMPASAAVVTVDIGGVITQIREESIDIDANTVTPIDIYDPATGLFDVGDNFIISLNISSAAAPTPTSDGQRYALSFTASFGAYVISQALGDVTIVNDRASGDILFFGASARDIVTPASGGEIAGVPFNNINFSFQNAAADAFDDDLLTLEKFVVTNFDGLFGSMVFSMREADNTITALSVIVSPQSMIISEVPLPAALPLFLAGFAGIGAAVRRRRKTA